MIGIDNKGAPVKLTTSDLSLLDRFKRGEATGVEIDLLCGKALRLPVELSKFYGNPTPELCIIIQDDEDSYHPEPWRCGIADLWPVVESFEDDIKFANMKHFWSVFVGLELGTGATKLDALKALIIKLAYLDIA